MLEKKRHYLLDRPSLKGNRVKNIDAIVEGGYFVEKRARGVKVKCFCITIVAVEM
jgi:hypothetical protein